MKKIAAIGPAQAFLGGRASEPAAAPAQEISKPASRTGHQESIRPRPDRLLNELNKGRKFDSTELSITLRHGDQVPAMRNALLANDLARFRKLSDIKQGADPTAALEAALAARNFIAIRRLIKAGVSPMWKLTDGTPLLLAIRNLPARPARHPVAALADRGLQPLRDSEFTIPDPVTIEDVLEAAESRREGPAELRKMQALLDKLPEGVDLSQALFYSVHAGNSAMLQLMLEHPTPGGDVNFKNRVGSDHFMDTAANKLSPKRELLFSLLSAGTDWSRVVASRTRLMFDHWQASRLPLDELNRRVPDVAKRIVEAGGDLEALLSHIVDACDVESLRALLSDVSATKAIIGQCQLDTRTRLDDRIMNQFFSAAKLGGGRESQLEEMCKLLADSPDYELEPRSAEMIGSKAALFELGLAERK